MKITAEKCIEILKKLASDNPDKTITRDFFRANSPITEGAWSKHFGTFSEFKRQAGVTLTRHAHKFELDIAKHASIDTFRAMNDQKRNWNEAYLKPTGSRFKTIMVCSDVHDIECDPFWRYLWMETLKRVQPEMIVINGDLFDLPEFGRYETDPRDWDVVGRIKWVHKFLEDIREVCPDTEITLIEGNHESVEHDTEILTDKGWVVAEDITKQHEVAQVRLSDNLVTYGKPLALAVSEQGVVEVKGNLHSEIVSKTHKVILDGKRVPVKDLIGQRISQSRFKYAGELGSEGVLLTDDEIRLLTWVITDATIVRRQTSNKRIQWKLSKSRKLKDLRTLLDKMGVEYTFRKATMLGCNKLQPYYICVYGDAARDIDRKLNEVKTYPASWLNLSKPQAEVLLETILKTNGSVVCNHSQTKSSKLEEVELLQRIFLLNGIPSKITTTINRSNFTANREIHILDIYNNGTYDRNYVTVTDLNRKGKIISIQTKEGTLITRRDGKPVVTGNCRLLKHLSEATPAMRAVLADLHGFTVPKLLGLDKYEVNYIAPADLAVFTKSDMKAQLKRNFLVIDEMLVAHHFPEGRTFGLPGFNGHHHKHLVDTYYSPLIGAYEWHQLGGGHKREASYCNGEKWTNGFLIVHTDTQRKCAQFEYVDTSHNHCIIGGKWYERND